MGKSANVTVFDPRLRESIGERLGSIGFDKDRNEIVYISLWEGILAESGRMRWRGARSTKQTDGSVDRKGRDGHWARLSERFFVQTIADKVDLGLVAVIV